MSVREIEKKRAKQRERVSENRRSDQRKGEQGKMRKRERARKRDNRIGAFLHKESGFEEWTKTIAIARICEKLISAK